MAFQWLRRHRKLVALVVLGIIVVPPLNSALGGDGDLMVVANAPKRGDAMTVTLAADPGVRGACQGTAEVEVLFPTPGATQPLLVYPRILGKVAMDKCRGSIDIPYDRFAAQNGQYIVRAYFDGKEAEDRPSVDKVANWVFVRAFTDKENERARIDVAFDRVLGQPLTSSVFVAGTLVMDIRWETCAASNVAGVPLPITLLPDSCNADGDLVFHAEIPIRDRASATIFIPYDNLENEKFQDERPPEGYYNVTAKFHNDQAKGNHNVPMDPTVYQEDPPGNWFEVAYE